MKRTYIAGPISGIDNYKAMFSEVHARLEDNGVLVMNPCCLPAGFDWDDYMPICFEMIRACNSVMMIPGWENSKGANEEKSFAESLGMEVEYYND